MVKEAEIEEEPHGKWIPLVKDWWYTCDGRCVTLKHRFKTNRPRTVKHRNGKETKLTHDERISYHTSWAWAMHHMVAHSVLIPESLRSLVERVKELQNKSYLAHTGCTLEKTDEK